MKRVILFAALICVMLSGCASDGQTPDDDVTQTPAAVTEGVTDAANEVPIETETTTSQTTTVTTTETTTETTTVTTTETTTVTELPFEDTPTNAYQRLYASFETDDGIVFPDDYAGTYSYFGKLYIAITEYQPSEAYTDILGDYTCVSYKTVRRSFNYLSEVSTKAAELLEPEFGVAEYFVDVPINKAAVAIKTGDPKAAQRYLKTIEDLGFTLDELEIVMAEAETEASEN